LSTWRHNESIDSTTSRIEEKVHAALRREEQNRDPLARALEQGQVNHPELKIDSFFAPV